MKVLLASAVLMASVAAPAAAQSASARMGASASVVAPVRVDDMAIAISRAGPNIDVTRPLAVGASVPWVLEVVAGAANDPGAQRLAVRRSTRSAGADAAAAADAPPEAVTVRLPARAALHRQRTLTYVVATVN